MTDYRGEHVEKITRDSGRLVLAVPLFSKFYFSCEMANLSNKYAFEEHSGIQGNTLGDTNLESFVGDLFTFYKAIKGLAGLDAKELEAYQETFNHAHCLSRLMPVLFDEQTIKGTKVIFPTEKLLQNQNVPLRPKRPLLHGMKVNIDFRSKDSES